MIRQLAKSIREYKRASIATPILVSFEVLMECTIPFIIARLVNEVKGGCDMEEILGYGGILVCMAILSLLFGGLARPGRVYLRYGFLRSGKESAEGYVLQYPGVFF